MSGTPTRADAARKPTFRQRGYQGLSQFAPVKAQMASDGLREVKEVQN
jgi:hypothetical protein